MCILNYASQAVDLPRYNRSYKRQSSQRTLRLDLNGISALIQVDGTSPARWRTHKGVTVTKHAVEIEADDELIDQLYTVCRA